MRIVRNVVVALAVMASATVAQGATQVWLQSPNVNGDGTGGLGGGAGQTLSLNCVAAAAPGSCSWVIHMAIGTTDGLFGWNTDLSGSNGSLAASAVGEAIPLPAGLGADPFTIGSLNGNPGSGAALLLGASGANSAPVNGQFALVQFTLTKSYGANEVGLSSVSARVNPSFAFDWSDANGGYPMVQWGSNLPMEATTGSQALLPVILINTTPEPGSLALLALGGLVAIRRRVSR